MIKQKPNHLETYNLLLGAALKQKDYDSLIHFGEQTIKIKAGSTKTHQMLGYAYSEKDQNEKAARHYELALEFAGKDETDSTTEREQLHNQLGLLRVKQEKYGLAIVQFENTLKLNAKQPAMLNAFAQALLTTRDTALKDPVTALKLAGQACILTRSKNAAYMGTLAVAYGTVGNLTEAAKVSEKALQLAIATGNKTLIAKQQRQLNIIRAALAKPKR